MTRTRSDLMARLERLGITTTTVEHPPLHTVEQSRALRGDIPGGHTKNLFLKCKKDRLWLVVALEDEPIDLKHLHERIGSGRLSFGRPELLMEVLGVTPGSVTPFALINDTQRRVNVVLDQRMMGEKTLNFHPLVNTATSGIAGDDLIRFVRDCGHEPRIAAVGAVTAD